jgi:hypothetical protein
MSTPRNNIIKLVCKTAPLKMQTAELKDVEFEAIPEFRNYNARPEVLSKHERRLQDHAMHSRAALMVLGQSKSQLIDMVRALDAEDKALADTFLQGLIGGRELASALLEMITAAESRLAVAIANA